MLQYMDTDSFVLSFTEDNVTDEPMDLSNLEKPIKTNEKVSKYQVNLNMNLENKIIEEFVTLSPKAYSFKDCPKKIKRKK